jgi:hypothetical protein
MRLFNSVKVFIGFIESTIQLLYLEMVFMSEAIPLKQVTPQHHVEQVPEHVMGTAAEGLAKASAEQMVGQVESVPKTTPAPAIVAEVTPVSELVELKKYVEKIGELVTGINRAKLTLLFEVIDVIGSWRCSSCKFNVNGVCMGWRLSQEFASKLNAVAGEEVAVKHGDAYRFKLSAVPFVGAVCPLYTQKA